MASLCFSPFSLAASRCADVAVCRTGPFSGAVTCTEAMARHTPGAPAPASLLTDSAGLRQGAGGHATAAGGESTGCFSLASPSRAPPGNLLRQPTSWSAPASALDLSRGPHAVKRTLGSRAHRGSAASLAASSLGRTRHPGAFRLRAIAGGSDGPSRQWQPSVDSVLPSGGPFQNRDMPTRGGDSVPVSGGAGSIAGLIESPGGLAVSVPSSIQSSMVKAFSSMVLMLKALQTYALQMRSMLYYEDFESVAHSIHREMQASFLWLFQQVFACTPCLMVAVMLLFSDFTVHSATSNIALEAGVLEEQQAPSAVPASSGATLGLAQVAAAAGSGAGAGTSASALDSSSWDEAASAVARSSTSKGGDRGGNGASGSQVASAFDDGDGVGGSVRGREGGSGALAPRPLDEDDFISMLSCEGVSLASDDSNHELVKLLEDAVQEMGLGLKEGEPVVHLRLDQDVVRRLVAPVSIHLEEDNYACFDCTELQYQLAIQKDPHNPMLLSNFAQFLFIVRRAYDK